MKIKHKGFFIAVIIYIAIVFGLYSYLYLIPSISKSLSKTYIVENGCIEQSYSAEALLVRNEKVYYADISGTLSCYIDESEKTRIGTKVADIYSGGNKNSMICEETGFISYYYDGLEESITPENVLLSNPEVFFTNTENPTNIQYSSVNKGDFVYKLVDDKTWYLLLPISEDNLYSIDVDDSIQIELSDGTVLKTSYQTFIGEDDLYLFVRVLSYYKDFCKVRTVSAKVVTKYTEGLLIPNTSVTQENGFDGVYVLKTDGKYHFVRVNILDKNDTMTVVTPETFTYIDQGKSSTIDTISLYDEILKNADKYNSN